jgi:endonuclease YncB( thermonuclease family)
MTAPKTAVRPTHGEALSLALAAAARPSDPLPDSHAKRQQRRADCSYPCVAVVSAATSRLLAERFIERGEEEHVEAVDAQAPDDAVAVRAALALVVSAAALAMLPVPTALAAICSNYPNQAATQRARDTIDGDGDGIYCEAISVRVRVPKTFYVKVRLIGIDTPESVRPGRPVECGAKDASANMERLAYGSGGTGRTVRLVTDPTQDTFDRYGRLLAYAYLASSGRGLQTEQLKASWAKVYVYGGAPFQLVDSFRRAKRRPPGKARRVRTLRRQLPHSSPRKTIMPPLNRGDLAV